MGICQVVSIWMQMCAVFLKGCDAVALIVGLGKKKIDFSILIDSHIYETILILKYQKIN